MSAAGLRDSVLQVHCGGWSGRSAMVRLPSRWYTVTMQEAQLADWPFVHPRAAWPTIWAPALQVVRETLNSRAAGNGDQGNASGVAQQSSQRHSAGPRPVRWWFDEGGLRSDRGSLAWTCRVARSRACVSGWR
jgi:hypothetical protein